MELQEGEGADAALSLLGMGEGVDPDASVVGSPLLGTLPMNYPCTNLSHWFQFVNGKYGGLG